MLLFFVPIRLRAVVYYYDTYYREYGSETFTADFSPCTEEWQFASVQFAKSKYRTINYVRVYCDYGYNTGTAYFDDIQLVRRVGLNSYQFFFVFHLCSVKVVIFTYIL